MIVKMDKVTIAGFLNQRNAVVRRLMRLGVVQLSDLPLSDEERSQAEQLTYTDDAAGRISEIEDELRKVKSAIQFLEGTGKKRKKEPKPLLDYEQFVDQKTYEGCWQKVFEANRVQKALADQNNRRNALQQQLASLSVWQGLDVPVEQMATKTTALLVGTVPAAMSVDALRRELDETGLAVLSVLSSDKDQSYVTVMVHNSVAEQTGQLLRSYGFSPVRFEGKTGSIASNMEALQKQIDAVNVELVQLQAQKELMAGNLTQIQMMYDYLLNMQERRKVRKHFLYTENAFFVGGWVPHDLADKVKENLEKKFDVYVEITLPEEGEETPVLLQNNAFVYPHELITELYSLPRSNGIDPTPVMSVFYCIFFGLMVSDAGYGIVMALLCGLYWWRLKPEGTMGKLIQMLFYGGLATAFWGILFGGWFGDIAQQAFGITIQPVWFNPLDDPMRLLIWSFIFGGIHLFVGMGVKGYLLIREGKWADALMDIGSWYLTLAGLALLFAGGIFATIGTYAAIAGAVALVLTQGRHEKNIFLKLKSGIMSLYDVTGYLSDILSYSRLLALGLATGVIASVVNTMATLGGGFSSIGGTLLLLVVFVAGHVFNIAINALGAYVHSSRLQYVEFFGKFYESGGKPFRPIKAKTKYLNIQKEIEGGKQK